VRRPPRPRVPLPRPPRPRARLGEFSSRGVAFSTLTARPSSSVSFRETALSAAASVSKVTKPYPAERP
jgi:hypothetical protein